MTKFSPSQYWKHLQTTISMWLKWYSFPLLETGALQKKEKMMVTRDELKAQKLGFAGVKNAGRG